MRPFKPTHQSFKQVEAYPLVELGSVRGRGVNSRTALAGIGVAIGPCG